MTCVVLGNRVESRESKKTKDETVDRAMKKRKERAPRFALSRLQLPWLTAHRGMGMGTYAGEGRVDKEKPRQKQTGRLW